MSKVSPTLPFTSITPTLLESFSVNHSVLPVGAAAIPAIPSSPGTGYSVIVPCGVIFPMFRPASSVNQRFPSGIAVMSHGWASGVGISYSVIVPVGVIFPIWLANRSVNQRLPSAPSVIP